MKNKQIERVDPDYLSIKSKKRKDHKQHRKKLFLSSGCTLSILETLPSSNPPSVGTHPKPLSVKTIEPQPPVLRVVTKHCTLAVEFQRTCLSDCSSRYDGTVSSNIAKLVEKPMSQMKTFFIGQKYPTSIIGFLATLKLPCHFTRFCEGAAVLILPHYVQESLENALNGCKCAENQLPLLVASVQNEGHPSRKLERSYPKVVKHRLMKYKTDHATAKCDAAILRYNQPANMTFQQYAADLISKSFKVANDYIKVTLNDLAIEEDDQPLRHSLQGNCATSPHADSIDIALMAE